MAEEEELENDDTNISVPPPRCLIDPKWDYTLRYWLMFKANIGRDLDTNLKDNPLFRDLIKRTGLPSLCFACINLRAVRGL